MVMFTYFSFRPEIPFSGKHSPKFQNCSFNTFLAIVPTLYFLKTPEIQTISGAFLWYKKLTRHELKRNLKPRINQISKVICSFSFLWIGNTIFGKKS